MITYRIKKRAHHCILHGRGSIQATWTGHVDGAPSTSTAVNSTYWPMSAAAAPPEPPPVSTSVSTSCWLGLGFGFGFGLGLGLGSGLALGKP